VRDAIDLGTDPLENIGRPVDHASSSSIRTDSPLMPAGQTLQACSDNHERARSS